MPQMWVLLVLVLVIPETRGPIAEGAGAATGMVGAPAMQEFQSEAACRRAGEAMDRLLGVSGWATERRSVQVRWACVPK